MLLLCLVFVYQALIKRLVFWRFLGGVVGRLSVRSVSGDPLVSVRKGVIYNSQAKTSLE